MRNKTETRKIAEKIQKKTGDSLIKINHTAFLLIQGAGKFGPQTHLEALKEILSWVK